MAGRLIAEGHQLEERGRRGDAITRYEAALQQDPSCAEAFRALGAAYWHDDRLSDAGAMWLRATQLDPDEATAHCNLGRVLRRFGRLQEAEAAQRRALEADPGFARASTSLGLVLRDQGRFAEAEAACRRAIALDGEDAEAHSVLGAVLNGMGRSQEAIAAQRRALALQPDNAGAHHDLALALLKGGQMEEGWNEFEWRWKSRLVPRTFPYPPWTGQDLRGRTVLVHAEQGLGDAIQFVRYVPLLVERGARVVLDVPKPLRRLFATVPGTPEIIGEFVEQAADEPPPADFHLAMLSAPGRFGTTLANIPSAIPYLFAAPDAVAAQAKALKTLTGIKVGLVWAGTGEGDMRLVNHRRSIDLGQLTPLLSMHGVSMVSLQVGEASQQIGDLPSRLRPLNPMDTVSDFADTAGLVANLDLVISVDTSVAHLAGAMGKPVWILSRFDGCWRWLLDRDDSPWYPRARLFRQTVSGDWKTVVERVTRALAETISAAPRG